MNSIDEKKQFFIRQAEAARAALDTPEITFRKWRSIILNDPFGPELDYIRKRAFFGLPWSAKFENQPRRFYSNGRYRDVFSDQRVQLSVSFAKGVEMYYDLGAMCTFSSNLMHSLCGHRNIYRRFWLIDFNSQAVTAIDIRPVEINNDRILSDLDEFSNIGDEKKNPKIATIDQIDEDTYFRMETLGPHCNEQFGRVQVGRDSIIVIATATTGYLSDGSVNYWTKLNLTVVKPADESAVDNAE